MSSPVGLSQERQAIARGEMLGHMLLIGVLVVLAWLAAVRGWDEEVTSYFFDASANAFRFRESWLFKGLLHDVGKLIPALAALLLGVVLFRGRRRASRCHLWRLEAFYALLTLVVSTAIAGYFKGTAPIYCPWSLTEYGGSMKHYTLIDWFSGVTPANALVGHCWPSGHSAGAFGLIGVYFGLRQHGYRHSLPALLALICWGALCSAAQIVRGAHFLSHVLWSIAICWTIALALLPLLRLGRRSRLPRHEFAMNGSVVPALIPASKQA